MLKKKNYFIHYQRECVLRVRHEQNMETNGRKQFVLSDKFTAIELPQLHQDHRQRRRRPSPSALSSSLSVLLHLLLEATLNAKCSV